MTNLSLDQWKNWSLIYSQVALKSILPHEHYECWLIFVQLHEPSTEEYMVQVHWIEDHPNKDWFGTEIQVWQPIQDAVASDYILTDNIVCRCAQVTTKIMYTKLLQLLCHCLNNRILLTPLFHLLIFQWVASFPNPSTQILLINFFCFPLSMFLFTFKVTETSSPPCVCLYIQYPLIRC